MIIEPGPILLFMAASLTLNITPGPDMLFVASRSMSQGRTAGVVSALGIAGGSLVHLLAAALGLSALLSYSATAFAVVKFTGAAYLIYLGIRSYFNQTNFAPESLRSTEPLRRIFFQGVLCNILNPKVAIFFISFLPQFVSPEKGSVTMQIIMLGLLFNCSGTIVNALVGLGAGSAGAWIKKTPVGIINTASRDILTSGRVGIATGYR